ncbi:aldehyde dehydrogenase family protein [candidate division KSB1 bacterium]|nr:aldehyde dehydrogenase family protein [candidate division KSB1 bacterium]
MNFINKVFINGQWMESDENMDVVNPYDQVILGAVPKANQELLNLAINTAAERFKTMRNLSAHVRSAILEKTADLLNVYQEEITQMIVLESGKAWKYALGEVKRAIQNFKFAAEEAKRIHGETISMDAVPGAEGRLGFFLRQPVGVIAAISPFNFPLNLVAHKVAPALAAGNTVVLKPSSYTPFTAYKLGEMLQQAGLPDGALNIVTGYGATVGEWLVSDPRVAMVTFTGSPPVGKRIQCLAGLKKTTMELGSNSAVIIDESADLDQAVLPCVVGSFANSGQICIAVQRIYVHIKVFDNFVEKFVNLTRQQQIGNPLDKHCDIGPMITLAEAERVEAWIQEAVDSGAKILTGGKRNMAIMEPTVLIDVKEDMKVIADEVFGPVVSIIPFVEIQEAIHRVDNSRYGLQAGIFTQNLKHALQAIRQINVGGVIVNDVPTFRADHMPYGGNKESGLGREGVRFAIEEMTNIKMVVIKDW